MAKWFTVTFWAYVLDDSRADKEYGPFIDIRWFGFAFFNNPRTGECFRNPFARAGNQLARMICRAKGHPAGVWFYNIGGSEPDMTCKGCGEDLG